MLSEAFLAASVITGAALLSCDTAGLEKVFCSAKQAGAQLCGAYSLPWQAQVLVSYRSLARRAPTSLFRTPCVKLASTAHQDSLLSLTVRNKRRHSARRASKVLNQTLPRTSRASCEAPSASG